MRVVIVYLIQGKARRYQESLIERVAHLSGENYLLENPLPQHVTLRSPFDVKDLKKLEQVVGDFTAQQKRASIMIRGFGNFEKKVAFLKPEFPKQARAIQRSLVTLVKDELSIPPHEFDLKGRPHATIAYGNTPETFGIIWDYLKLRKPRYRLDFDNITILTKPRRYWKIHKVYELQC